VVELVPNAKSVLLLKDDQSVEVRYPLLLELAAPRVFLMLSAVSNAVDVPAPTDFAISLIETAKSSGVIMVFL
jgi:hypothetical protein